MADTDPDVVITLTSGVDPATVHAKPGDSCQIQNPLSIAVPITSDPGLFAPPPGTVPAASGGQSGLWNGHIGANVSQGNKTYTYDDGTGEQMPRNGTVIID